MGTRVRKSVFLRIGMFFCSIVLLFSMGACTSAEKKHYEECLVLLKTNLYDPTSLLVAEATSVSDPESDDIAYKITYNAKNLYGAYVGNKTEYFLYDSENGAVERDSFGLVSLQYKTWTLSGGKTKSYV